MNIAKKVFNVFGIILAWVLSIALVIMLVVTPIVFSALSLISADTITKALTQSFDPSAEVQKPAEEVTLVQLSSTTEESTPAGGTDASQFGDLSGIFGDQISQETLDKILSSNAAKELIEAYTDDLADAFTGNGGEAKFNSEKIKSIVNDNIDEIVDVLQEAVPELADMDKGELKSQILKAVDEGAEEIVNALPKPEDIKQEMMESNPALETALQILAQKDMIMLAIIGVIVVISALIFVCRIPGLRGFRWLAVNLFVGGGFNAFTSVGLLVSKSAVSQIAEEAGPQIAGIIGSLLGDFTTGMFIRTAVMLVSGGALLTVYILIKKAKAKKLTAAEQAEALVVEEAPAEETPAEENAAEEAQA